MYIILLCGKKFVNILWLCIPRTLFSGQKSDAISIVVLTLGVRVVLFSYEVSGVSATDSLSWLSYIISSKLWAFGSTHGTEAYFPWRLLYIPPDAPYLLNYDFNRIFLTLIIHSNMFLLLFISSYQFIYKFPPSPTCLHFNCHILKNDPLCLLIIASDRFRRQLRHKLHW